MTEKKAVLGIQYLRGFAALGVLLCHYGSSVDYPLLSKIFTFGQNGVQVFFLISGFIIVYSLQQANYQPRQFLRFLAKRSIRIDPAYYATIVLTLLLFKVLSLIPSFKGETIPLVPGQLLAHLVYIVPFTKYEFYNHIFWTLCVEFQFYILIGLLYFLSNSKIYKILLLLLFCASSFIKLSNSYYLVFTYAPVFCLGISLVELYLHRNKYDVILPVIFTGVILFQNGVAICALLVLACMVIFFIKTHNKVLFWLGQTSYSLYLTHILVFIIVAGAFKKMHFNLARHQLLWLFIEAAIAILFAAFFYLAVEKPSLRLSKRIFYNRKLKE